MTLSLMRFLTICAPSNCVSYFCYKYYSLTSNQGLIAIMQGNWWSWLPL